MSQSPTWPPAPSIPDGRIHVWRSYPFYTRRAPGTGYYAVGRQTEFLRRYERFPAGITQ